jgi:F-type H+-transporting ATPase subunit a
VETTPQTSRKWKWGFHRWLIILLIVGNVIAARAYSPIMPHVQVPAEALAGPINLPIVGELYLTNTIVAVLLADVLLIAMAYSVRRAMRGGTMVPSGIAGAVEAMVEALYNITESSAMKWAPKVFPWVATIVLLVLVVNLTELIPGVDSIGLLHEVHGEVEGHPTRELFSIFGIPISTIVKDEVAHAGEQSGKFGIIPFVRVTSTDLNFTVALALTSVVVSQILGVRAAGLGYFKKFFQFGGLRKMLFRDKLGPFELIFPFTDMFVGLLELVAEIAKIISFSFRLFGNIFAGSVLLFVMGSLIPVALQSGFLGLELFVGLIQALVFGMLTLVFMTMATMSHDEHAEEHGAID